MLSVSTDENKSGDEPPSLLVECTKENTQLESALEAFRENWKHELQPITESDSNQIQIKECAAPEKKKDDEIEAQRLFQLGVDCEKRGKVYDALQYYRKAVQIIPDIEFRAYDTSKNQAASNENRNPSANVVNDERNTENVLTSSDNDVEDLSNVDLLSKFQNDLLDQEKFISSSIGSNVLTTELHISDLPTEIILHLFRWVISSQLDVFSLDQCAAVCKGFYICARDEKIWKEACSKVWGSNTGMALTPYLSWRQMFAERTRVHYNGCYISKTKYIRYGENSFQSQFYRPIQVIEYYRYFRFFPDGTVIMMTTTDEPAQSVSKLKNVKELQPAILRGNYFLIDDAVILRIQKEKKIEKHPKRRSSMAGDPANSNTYHIEFSIVTVSSKKRFAKLIWKHYSIIQIINKNEMQIPFELTASNFPPLWFSQVKSYHLEADAPL